MGNKGQKTSRLRKMIQSTLITAPTGRKKGIKRQDNSSPSYPKPGGQHDLLAKGHSPVLAADESRKPAGSCLSGTELAQPGVLFQLVKGEVGRGASMAAEEICPRLRQPRRTGRTLISPGWKQLPDVPGTGRISKETTQVVRRERKEGKNLIHLSTPKI